jgi:predicted Zn-dependent protease
MAESEWRPGTGDRVWTRGTAVTTNHYTLQSNQVGMCDDLLTDAGYDPAEHEDLLDEMALAADLAAVDAAYEVMREHGLKTLADRERDGESGTGDAVGNVPGSAGLAGGPARGKRTT